MTGEVKTVSRAARKCAVDIEHAERDFGRVAERYLSPTEVKIAEQYNLYAEMWCAKEALYKLYKKGSVDLVKDLVIAEYRREKSCFVATIFCGEPIEIEIRREGPLAIAKIG